MTDVIRPELVWIEGRCYRINDPTIETTTYQEHDLYEKEEVTFNDPDDDDEDEDEFEVVTIDNNRYSTSIHVSKHYFGAIIGKKGAMKMRIERDTRTEIKIPRQGQTGDIKIYGPSASNIKAARRRINIIVISSRMRQKLTHFISIPMNSPSIIKNFETFKEIVLRDCPSRGLEESLFISAQKLHITVGVMCLMDNEERLHVTKLFTEAKDKIIMPLIQDHLPLRIRLKGLSYMNDDPREINVLYGVVQEEGTTSGWLQNLADALVKYFSKAGFMNDEEFNREHVKLHVTVINSKYRSKSSETSNDVTAPPSDRTKAKITFDGSEILKKFADYDFGVAELTDIHLSQSHSMGPDGYYIPTCVVSCNKVTLGFENQTAEAERRIAQAWAIFGANKQTLRGKIPYLKVKVFEWCVMPVLTYGTETMTLTQKSAEFRVAQRGMERAMIGITLRDRRRNEWILNKTRVKDVMAVIAKKKWTWARHIARMDESRWTRRVLEWRPRAATRGRGRPPQRWVDDIRRHGGRDWMSRAQDRLEWKTREEAYIQDLINKRPP
ncbi:activating signal cointegrator 1 complex subunit 1 [Aphomia sociella]